MTDVTVQLGEHTVPVVAQRWRYLTAKLGDVFSGFTASGQDVTAGNFAVFLGGAQYRALTALIPALAARMPEWEFNGFATLEAAERGEYDPDAGREPTTAQLVAAFEAAWKVSRLDVLGGLSAIVDPTLLRAQANAFLIDQVETQTQTPVSSPISPSTNGTSPSTSSTASSPTSSVSVDSPSDASQH